MKASPDDSPASREPSLELDKTYTVHLKAQGEVCNRLVRGTQVLPVRRKGDWVKITWRKGKKKGWIFFPNPSI